jgi:hypothetical protein
MKVFPRGGQARIGNPFARGFSYVNKSERMSPRQSSFTGTNFSTALMGCHVTGIFNTLGGGGVAVLPTWYLKKQGTTAAWFFMQILVVAAIIDDDDSMSNTYGCKKRYC